MQPDFEKDFKAGILGSVRSKMITYVSYGAGYQKAADAERALKNHFVICHKDRGCYYEVLYTGNGDILEWINYDTYRIVNIAGSTSIHSSLRAPPGMGKVAQQSSIFSNHYTIVLQAMANDQPLTRQAMPATTSGKLA